MEQVCRRVEQHMLVRLPGMVHIRESCHTFSYPAQQHPKSDAGLCETWLLLLLALLLPASQLTMLAAKLSRSHARQVSSRERDLQVENDYKSTMKVAHREITQVLAAGALLPYVYQSPLLKMQYLERKIKRSQTTNCLLA